jgi:hypothetical protein
MEHVVERIKQVIERAKNILFSPRESLEEIKAEDISAQILTKDYTAIIAIIPVLANFIGEAIIGHPIVGHKPFFRSLVYAGFSYGLLLASFIIVGKIINALASYFEGTPNDSNAFKAAVFSLTPGCIAGVFSISYSLSALSLIGTAYGIYILYLSVQILMDTPKEKAITYTVVGLIASLLVMVILARIASAIVWGGSYGY